MKNAFFLITYFLCVSVTCQEKTICITVDDLPTVNYGLQNLDNEITSKLIRSFKKYNIPAIGYVNAGKLYSNNQLDSSRVENIVKWLENGYDLGNHTFSHLDYNKVPDSTFFNDVLKGEKVIKPLMKKFNKKLKYFRHPYLHAGHDSLSHKNLEKFLKDNDYVSAPVTIDNDDYLFAKSYHNAYVEKDSVLMKEIGAEYIRYMEKKLLFFESKSTELFNRNIPQTLLIHASLLNGDYLNELAKMIQKHGYTFISQEEVLQCKEYNTLITTYSKRGFSWIFRWGISEGLGNDFMDGDVSTPKKIIELAKQ